MLRETHLRRARGLAAAAEAPHRSRREIAPYALRDLAFEARFAPPQGREGAIRVLNEGATLGQEREALLDDALAQPFWHA